MKVIYKYRLEIDDVQHIEMPVGAVLLSVQVQDGQPYVWALVDKDSMHLQPILFKVYGTGHDIDEHISKCKFLGTVQLMRGGLVFHIFYKL